MPPPLQPVSGAPDPDALLERFLEYAEAKGLELYPEQEEAILSLFAGESVILATPTGSGKSLVAAALHFLAASTGRRSVYTCPIKALVNEKFFALCRDFGPENVGMATGDATVNRDAPILCCTAEILANLALRQGADACIQDVVIDEFHYYADPARGAAWQVPLLALPQRRFLLISATLGDPSFFAGELERRSARPCRVVATDKRPVPLAFEYLEIPLVEAVEQLRQEGKLPVYIVHFAQRAAAETAQSLLSLNVCAKEEKRAIAEEIQDVAFASPFGKDMQRLLRGGVGLHHAGLLPKYRALVERLAQKGLLKLVCGTDTLGVGVNVPIRSVLFTQLCKYDGDKTALLAARDFHQISGRAGRKGFDDEGFVVALAPEHVIENKRLERKAGDDPKKRRKIVRKQPPAKGFVPWDQAAFEKLVASPPEPLVSRFDVSHAMLVNVLGRPGGDGCAAMRRLIAECHNPPASKLALRRRAFQLLRSLVEKGVVELRARGETGPKVRLNVDLPDDFSLNQTLALYFVDTLSLFDKQDPQYALKVLSLAEAILENPGSLLRRQLDKLKSDKLAELKAAGVPYEQRVDEIEALERPKPEGDFIYATFNAFAAAHPWVGSENIQPKSIAREMYERYSSFSDYVKLYGLARFEGVLLRHLASVYRVLDRSVPPAFITDALAEALVYFERLLRTVDSSLLDEWERLRNPEKALAANGGGAEEAAPPPDVTKPPEAFARLVRDEVFRFLGLLAGKQYQALADQYDLGPLLRESEAAPPPKWPDVELAARMEPYYRDRRRIRLDPPARAKPHTRISVADDQRAWLVEQTLIDEAELNDWRIRFRFDLDAARAANAPVATPLAIEPIASQHGGAGDMI